MKKITRIKKQIFLLWTLFLLVGLLGCQPIADENSDTTANPSMSNPSVTVAIPSISNPSVTVAIPSISNPSVTVAKNLIKKNHDYSSKDEVAEYINRFHKLPPNYITKGEAEKQGWDNSKGNLWEVAFPKSIGGDRFGNREGLLPKLKGRIYYECDIDYSGGYRGAKRIVYSNDRLVFYTEDHYKTFEKLY